MPRDVEALIDRLVDEGGMPDYVRSMFPNSVWGDPDGWPPEAWEALRQQLWQDCYDGERYWWQPEVPLIRSLYERQAAA